MEKRILGHSGLEAAPLVFGGNIFGWTVDEPTCFQLLDAFVQKGFTFIDTADVYSKWVPGNKGGESETMIGNWLKTRNNRRQVIIATKVGMMNGLTKPEIMKAADGSLQRLQTDYIDLYQAHKDDPNTPLEETLSAFDQLIKDGKVGVIGVSNYSAERLKEVLALSKKMGLPTCQSLQPLYNLYDREDYEKNLEPLCLAAKVGVISYYSLASGFLTGKYRSEQDFTKSKRGAGMSKYLNDRGFKILAALDQVAKETNSTPAAVSLAWLIARPSVTAPIASATSIAQLDEMMSATELKLDTGAMDLLNRASAWLADG
jgi:aryl-alcohol dehydrogenase-like predicted oxidoreductase